MENLIIGKRYYIYCYKHNGSRHRMWKEAVLLDVKEDYLVFGNNKTKVIDASGKFWYTREPAIVYFFKDKWYNVIGQIKENGIYYYCNIASPMCIEGNIIKYIDYDLDLRVFPNGSYKILDQREYEYHKKLMDYPDTIDRILKYELNNLIKCNENKEEPFDSKTIEYYYSKYCEYVA